MGRLVVPVIIAMLVAAAYEGTVAANREAGAAVLVTQEASATLDILPADETAAQRLDGLWAAQDWAGVVDLLTPMRADDVASAPFDRAQKLYAAHINAGNVHLRAGRATAAAASFAAAAKLDPLRIEASDGLRRLPHAGAQLELLSGTACDHSKAGNVFVCTGEVRNISGQTLSGLMVESTFFTASGVYVATTAAPLRRTVLAPGQTVSFATFVPGSATVHQWRVAFRELFGPPVPTFGIQESLAVAPVQAAAALR